FNEESLIAVSGKTGRVLWRHPARFPGKEGRHPSLQGPVMVLDDVDGDGVPDLIAHWVWSDRLRALWEENDKEKKGSRAVGLRPFPAVPAKPSGRPTKPSGAAFGSEGKGMTIEKLRMPQL